MRAGEKRSAAPSYGTDAAGMRLSLPLYLGGLIVTLCGVQAVCATMEDTGITLWATVLSLMGFAFSLGCRALKIQPRVIEIAGMVLIGVVVCEWVLQGQIFGQNLSWYITGADKTEDRLAAGLMWSAVFWSWTVVSGDIVLFSCVLTAAMIGLTGSVNVNNSTIFFFCLFVLAMIFLLIYQNYLQNRLLASAQERSRPLRVLWAHLVLSAVSAGLVLGAGTIIVVPLRTMLSSLSLGQAMRQLVGGQSYAGTALNLVGQRFSDDTGLDIGRGSVWPTSPDVVMHATSTDNQPHYWRGRTYDFYTGTGWQSLHQNSRQNTIPLDWQEATDTGRSYGLPTTWIQGEGQAFGVSALRTRITTTLEVKGDTTQFYYADEPRSLLYDTDDSTSPHLSTDGSLDLDGRSIRGTYSLVSTVPPDPSDPHSQTHLRRDSTVYPAVIRRLYLAAPPNSITSPADTALFQTAVRDALQDLPPNRRSPLDQALALQRWITNQCTYSLSVDPLPAHQDHVRAFLFGTRRGYCDLFASSMVVLCRAAGIPARLATGFAPGDPSDGGYDIRAMDKHAWAEVYFPGDGWLIFDPTVGSRTDGTVPGQTRARQGLWQRARVWMSANGPLPLILSAALVLCLLYVVKTEAYDRRRAPRRARRIPPAPAVRARTDLGRHYAHMTRALAALGLPRRASETPAEYEARILPLLRRREAVLGVPLGVDAVHALTAQFVAARYGGSPAGDGAGAARLARQVAQGAARARFAQWQLRLRGGVLAD